MKFFSSIALILFCFAACSFAADQKLELPPLSKEGISPALAKSIGCTSFRWSAVDGLSDKAELMVPIVLEGKEYWFQLDTGSDMTFISGTGAKERGWQTLFANIVRVPNGALGGMQLPALQVGSRPDLVPDKDSQGTVGLDLLIGHLVILDFPGRHFCVLPAADLPAALGARLTATIPAEVHNGHLHLKVSVNEEPLDVIYDTGSSAFGLIVDWELWKKLTRASSEKDARLQAKGPRFGNSVRMLASPSSGELKVETFRFAHPLIATFPATPDLIRDSGSQGWLGNSPFFDHVVVLDLGVYPQIYVATP